MNFLHERLCSCGALSARSTAIPRKGRRKVFVFKDQLRDFETYSFTEPSRGPRLNARAASTLLFSSADAGCGFLPTPPTLAYCMEKRKTHIAFSVLRRHNFSAAT